MSAAKQKILPFFLPMRGCPAPCVYCDQYAISGAARPPELAEIAAALAAFAGGSRAELAYYGGSFTCLPRAEQAAYLEAARPAIADGRLAGVRVSTRPDSVDAETCAFLREHGVITVELGVQSFDDAVLAASGRGYTAAVALAGCDAVRQAGLTLGVQLMTGLPADSARLSRDSLRTALGAGASLLRVYPTLVLRGTPLATMYEAGGYRPQTLAEAVALAADLLAMALAAGVTMLRIGLHTSADVEAALVAGPYHPAFGGLVREELRARQVRALLAGCPQDQPAILRFCRAELPLVFGDGRRRLTALAAQYPLLALLPDAALPAGSLLLSVEGRESRLEEAEFCRCETARLAAEDGAPLSS